ncbi:MAG: EAL domain-containing protein [Rhodoferax sp.]|jgi:diguanylate cyclase (GGDEF)-like protein|uniref:putative bifunctional diguanylate cyclase/phosphodiesterase n=1 Tax=Rhodoferax sp. TaxID=50421 RepID=UPI002715BEF4|nr:EAL domain-containing protein [Rhodoferax sp.]MDO9143165.1 EAL domain-containing protein [Rhodoferax sp.]MDP1531291.1 EAL domain-containing protein [Rhodoferax sp.]MDP1942341.1 EAL domain-containing protein [Rhodoferax sp.]MDP3192640.1 EAL domain-containing protein [Rhodoferax sp.]MDP3337197.1 EAL domain-containing protein [Rhodoferax sp.]
MTIHFASIRARLILAFSVLLGLLLAVAAVSLQRLEVLTATTQEIVNYQARRVFMAQSMNLHAQAAAIDLLKLLQTPERDQRVPLYAAMDEEMAASAKAVHDLAQTGLAADLQSYIGQVTDLQQRYATLLQETVELLEIEGPTKARTHFEDRTHKVLNTLLFESRALETHLQQMMQSRLEQLRESATQATHLVVLLALCALVAGTGLAWAVARGIVLPLQKAVSIAKVIASGDYRQDVPNGRRDEVGALLRALRVMRDSISNREEKILRLAYIDPLTDLPNRTRFMELFDARVSNASGALMLLNVDRFAPINNALGYKVGDHLLCQVALRITRSAGESSLVARLWGDKFAIMLAGVDQLTAADKVQQILAAVRAPMTITGQRLDIDASVGVTLYPQDGTEITTLLRHVNVAMTVAKHRQDSMVFVSELDNEPDHQQLSLLGEMRDALVQGEFIIYYQPKLNLKQNKVTAVEALIRWRHPVKGLIPPMQFIPFAEQTGFIREITPWVLRQVIEDAADWRHSGISPVVSVNLSTRDLLNHGLVEDIQRLLMQSGMSAEQLCLEITESALMDEPELALRHLNELSAFGLKLSIDDYGTGQSSLAYVKTLPVDELKIDRTFVTAVDVTPRNAAIVRSTILLCRELGLSVVAEGAETAEELAWLKSNQCDFVQGYGVAKPMPLTDFIPWVQKFNHS